jgi:hypothetical protein
MLTAILLISAVITYAVMIGTYLPQSKYSNGMLFAVTLPKEAAQHEAVQRIRERFKKDTRNISILMLVSLVPAFFLGMSFQILYFLIWLCVLVVVIVFPFRRAHRDTLALKRRNEWFIGDKKAVQTDLRAMMLKNKRSAPYWLFAIPFAFSVWLTVWLKESGLMALGITAMLTVVLFAFISAIFRNARTKVYSRNSDLNVSLNQAARSIWTYTFLSLAFIEVLHFALVGYFLLSESSELEQVWIAYPAVYTLIPIALIWNASRRIKRIVDEAVEADGQTIYSDGDEYWGNGFTYHNPNDRRVFVEKRIGIGMTVNTGTTAGKWFMGITLGIAAAVLIGVSFLLVHSELKPPVLSISEERQIEIDYVLYSIDFPAEAMLDIALVEELPRGRRINGEATDTVARGHFNLDGLGKSRLYLFKNNPPYIRIQLADTYIFYNEKDPDQTRQVYERLMKLKRQDSGG